MITLGPVLSITIAFLAGILPTMIWLFFWNREDRKNPEPKGMILLAFIGGISAVFVSLYLEKIAYGLDIGPFLAKNFSSLYNWLLHISSVQGIPFNRLILVAVFAPIIEELTKFVMAFILVLRSKSDDEPIDPVIYMITVALGFAAVENALFLIDPIAKSNFIFGILTGNMRFIGATLLHTISSATIGMFIGFNFFDKKLREAKWTAVGIVCAIIIHSLFNFFMVMGPQNSFTALEIIWVGVIILLIVFEKIKRRELEKIS